MTERTLRDEFAMAALPLAVAKVDKCGKDLAAKIAYEYADAMMAARIQGRTPNRYSGGVNKPPEVVLVIPSDDDPF